MAMGKWLGIIILVYSSVALAAVQKLETIHGKIFVPELIGWELGRDMFGMPFIYFSPRTNGQRSNISLTATGVDVEVNLADMAKNPDAYKMLKLSWAKEVDATAGAFIPYKNWKNDQGHTVHEIGFEYAHLGKSYIEKSFYVDCRSRLIYLKSLRLEQNTSHESGFYKIVKELDCGL
jgi:hypothetical protein